MKEFPNILLANSLKKTCCRNFQPIIGEWYYYVTGQAANGEVAIEARAQMVVSTMSDFLCKIVFREAWIKRKVWKKSLAQKMFYNLSSSFLIYVKVLL